MNQIYYFTGTGNSLQLSNDLAKELGSCTLHKITEYQGETIEADTIGIIFPVYNWGIPLIIKRFLETIQTKKDTYIYCITNCNRAPGKALIQCKTLLEQRGYQLSLGYVQCMPGNYIVGYGALSKEKQASLFEAEKKRIPVFAHAIKNREVHKPEKKLAMLNPILFQHFYKEVEHFNENDRKYIVDESCIGCGICAAGCPVKNIEMKQNHPVFLHHCEFCLSCVQHCPKQAINYGDSTKNRVRYVNPNV